MGIETRVKPISYLKAHSAEVIRDLGEGADHAEWRSQGCLAGRDKAEKSGVA
jgi:hypothetical protein